MTIEEIERLIRRLEQSDVTELDVSDATASLMLRLAPRQAEPGPREPEPAKGPAPDGSREERVLRAAALGRLHLRHPEAAPDAELGFPRAVARGNIVAFLEAGGCLRPILAEEDCTIGDPLLAEGSLVGYGTPVFPLL